MQRHLHKYPADRYSTRHFVFHRRHRLYNGVRTWNILSSYMQKLLNVRIIEELNGLGIIRKVECSSVVNVWISTRSQNIFKHHAVGQGTRLRQRKNYK